MKFPSSLLIRLSITSLLMVVSAITILYIQERYDMRASYASQTIISQSTTSTFQNTFYLPIISSPFVERIVFTSNRNGNEDIYSMYPDGSNVQRLTSHPAQDGNADLSPDGKFIAFTSWRDKDYEIYVLNLSSQQITRLTFTPGIDDDASWSPDGQSLAFTSHRDGNAEVYVMNRDGSQQRRLTQRQGYDVRPAWSPDGQWLVYESWSTTAPLVSSLAIMRRDGSQRRQLTSTDDRWPSWSPNRLNRE
jgi:TolB protein